MPETPNQDSGAPLALHQESVQSAWIDYNGHMNVAYYVLAFDHATDAFLEHFDLGEKFVDRLGVSTFVVEAHVNYLQEVREGDMLRFETLILGIDPKKLRLFHTMIRVGDDGEDLYRAATNELMMFAISMETRRSTPWPQPAFDQMIEVAETHRHLPPPAEAGRSISLVKKR